MSALSISYRDPDDLQTRVKDLETKLKYLNTENTQLIEKLKTSEVQIDQKCSKD